MKLLLLPALAALLATTAALPQTSPARLLTEADIRDYATVPMTYTGPITLGGPDISLTGTDAVDIYAQILHRNPQFNPMDWAHLRDAAAELGARTITGVQCDNNPAPYQIPALASALKEGIAALSKMPGKCGTAGGHQAARMACSWDSAIWFINNNAVGWSADCTWVAGMGQRIYDQCRTGLGIEATGQVWDSQNYVVLSASYASC